MLLGNNCPHLFTNKVGHKFSSNWEITTPAKLNLYLEILGRRADGFHALETLMVPVRVYDQLSWQEPSSDKESSRFTLQVNNLLRRHQNNVQLLGKDQDNLVLRAARLLAETAGIEPYGHFQLTKRIPIQAGMGGGSSDAAAALLLANSAWQLGYTTDQLMPLAAQLGSDVPFFLGQGAAICRGRGELIEAVDQLPKMHFVVVKPDSSLSTAEVFGQLSAQNKNTKELTVASRLSLNQLLTGLRSGNLAAAGRAMTNRLETAAARLAPWLQALRNTFSQLSCLAHFMTGSGSAYVGMMRSAKQARQTARRLSGMDLGTVFATSSC